MRILLVEDDESLAQMLYEAFTSQHYLVDFAQDGQAGWELAEAFAYDLIVLDLILPKLDGINFCKQLRQQGKGTPILLLTGVDSSSNKVTLLDAGADDYVVKPFNLHELLARIRALLRRGTSTVSPVLEWGLVRLDPSNCEVRYDGQLLHLTSKEYALMELFLRNSRRIFSQSTLLDHLWSFDEPPSENTVRAHMKSLRQKLRKAGATADLIETVYGQGYRLKSKEVEATDLSRSLNQEPVGKIIPQIAAIWEQHQYKYSDRIKILEQAVTDLMACTLSEELRQKAFQEAHTLVGSLGSFGFAEASRLCHEIEQLFQTKAESKTMGENLSKLVIALRQQLQQTPVILKPKAPIPTPGKQQSRLLIVDDDVALAQAMAKEATAWGMQVVVATDLSSARIAIANARPDVVLLDLCFSDSQENGFDLLSELTTYQPPIPVLVFTNSESFADRVKVARLGGRGFLHKPISPTQVMNALAQVVQKSTQPEIKLLIVDDDQQMLDFLYTSLEPWGFKLTLLNDPQQFWSALEQTNPDLLILDVEMPEITGITLCQVVRNDPRWQELPVLFVSAYTNTQTVERVFAVGADDYVNKPIVESELVARVLNRLERIQILRKFTQG